MDGWLYSIDGHGRRGQTVLVDVAVDAFMEMDGAE